jgi:hypothetical protein
LSLAKIFGPFWKQTYVVAESTIPENVWKHRLLPENRGAVMATTRDAVNLPSTVGHYVISETVAIRGGNPAMHSKSEYRAHVNLLSESGTLTGRRGRICGCHTSKNTRESHIYIYIWAWMQTTYPSMFGWDSWFMSCTSFSMFGRLERSKFIFRTITWPVVRCVTWNNGFAVR